MLTGIQTQSEAGVQPGASDHSRLVCGKINFATATKSRKSEPREGLFYFIGLKPQDLAFLKHWESSGFILWPTALKVFTRKGSLADGILWFILSPNNPS